MKKILFLFCIGLIYTAQAMDNEEDAFFKDCCLEMWVEDTLPEHVSGTNEIIKNVQESENKGEGKGNSIIVEHSQYNALLKDQVIEKRDDKKRKNNTHDNKKVQNKKNKTGFEAKNESNQVSRKCDVCSKIIFASIDQKTNRFVKAFASQLLLHKYSHDQNVYHELEKYVKAHCLSKPNGFRVKCNQQGCEESISASTKDRLVKRLMQHLKATVCHNETEMRALEKDIYTENKERIKTVSKELKITGEKQVICGYNECKETFIVNVNKSNFYISILMHKYWNHDTAFLKELDKPEIEFNNQTKKYELLCPEKSFCKFKAQHASKKEISLLMLRHFKTTEKHNYGEIFDLKEKIQNCIDKNITEFKVFSDDQQK